VQTVHQWRTIEIGFDIEGNFANPYKDIEVHAVFTGPGGVAIRRPAFWDGGSTWRVRFAPTLPGTWHYILLADEPTGIDLHIHSDAVQCLPANAGQAIFERAFLTRAPGTRHLSYGDGTPFFWLGDTHWRFAHERWDEANKLGWTSQFRGSVDRRVEQGFSVYQSNLMMFDWGNPVSPFWTPGNTFDELDVPYFQTTIDPRMAYIAERGLVNALGLGWYEIVDNDQEGVNRFARYIVARYGSYPVVWILGGEVAGYDHDKRIERIDNWRRVAEAIRAADSYDHPRTAHATNERPLAPYYQGEEWLTLTLNQHGHGDFDVHPSHYLDFISAHPQMPLVEGESMYEGLTTVEYAGRRPVTDSMVRHVAYRAMQSGCCGYTYGAQGCWNGARDRDDAVSMWGDMPWHEGIDLQGANQLGHLREFYENLPWPLLSPKTDCFRSESVFNRTIYAPQVTADPDLPP
jgi:hypothetical protein